MTNKVQPVLDLDNLPDVAATHMLISMTIRMYEGNFKNKSKSQEIIEDNNAHSKNAVRVYESLFADCDPLDKLKNLRGRMRQWFNRYTQAFNRNGLNLVSTEMYMNEINAQWPKWENEWNTLVNAFFASLNAEISKQAFQRGKAFDRSQYPTEDELRDKFELSHVTMPFPLSDNYVMKAQAEVLKVVRQRTDTYTQSCVQIAMTDAWERIKAHVERVRERMDAVLEYDPLATEEIKEYNDDGSVKSVQIKKARKPKLHDSMLDDGLELCQLLKDMNVAKDPALEEARVALEKALIHVDMDSLKEDKALQTATRKAMQDLADKFF